MMGKFCHRVLTVDAHRDAEIFRVFFVNVALMRQVRLGKAIDFE
jgi:hypothetical protein